MLLLLDNATEQLRHNLLILERVFTPSTSVAALLFPGCSTVTVATFSAAADAKKAGIT